MTPEIIRKAIFNESNPTIEYYESGIVQRPPTLCAGCPHRGLFYELGKRKNVMVSGDIGCYTLGFAEPYNAMDINICMGSSISIGHGAQQIFDMQKDNKMRVVSVIGDSTFFHSGINSLLDVTYNGSKVITIILDNRTTGMTGHQQNPGTGYTLQGKETIEASIEALVKACGIENVVTVNPNDLEAVKRALDWAFDLEEPSVIITRWPCALKKLSENDREEFGAAFSDKCMVDIEKCIGCKMCTNTGCPAISLGKQNKKATINQDSCVGCGVCLQVCPAKAIGKVEA